MSVEIRLTACLVNGKFFESVSLPSVKIYNCQNTWFRELFRCVVFAGARNMVENLLCKCADVHCANELVTPLLICC